MRQISLGVIVVLALVFGIITVAEADVSEGFNNFENGTRPRGWTFAYCGQDSDANTVTFGAASPSITMDAYGDQITTIDFTSTGVSTLQFWIESLASNPSSSLLVREYVSAAWTRLTLIETLPAAGTTIGPLALNPSGTTKIDFTYKEVANVDLVIDDVAIVNVATPAPSAPPSVGPTPVHLVVQADDYDGDGTSDISTYDPATGIWDIRNVTSGIVWGGGSNDIPAPGDYDGDGVADMGYFDRDTGQWYARDVATGATLVNGTTWGVVADLPALGDYNGDGTADLATWRLTDGHWRIQNITDVWYGQVAGMMPVPGDYNGDGTTDMAMVNPATGIWNVNGIANRWWMTSDGLPKPVDYAGDGTTELVFYRATNRIWAIRPLVGAGTQYRYWGLASDMPTTGDFDGDGAADITQLRPSISRWWIDYSGGSPNFVDFAGAVGDTLVTGASN